MCMYTYHVFQRGSVKKSRVITFDDEDGSPNGLLRPDAISKSTSCEYHMTFT